MKLFTVNTKKLLESYFEMDADMLLLVQSGEVKSIEIAIDDEKQYAEYTVKNDCNDANAVQDDYRGVSQWIRENILPRNLY